MNGGTGIVQGRPPQVHPPEARSGVGAATILLKLSALDLRPLPGAVPSARGHTRAVLSAWRLDALSRNAELVTSELVTNACRAANENTAGADPCPVGLQLQAVIDGHSTITSVVVSVWDASPQMPKRRTPEPDAISGRGLLLVEAHAVRWGFYRTGATGKAVWAMVTR